MWSEMNPIGTSTTAPTPSACSVRRWSLTSGSSQAGWAVRSVSSRPGRGRARSPAGRHLPGHLGGDDAVPVDVRAGAGARLRPAVSAMVAGMEWVTNTSRACAAARPAGRARRGWRRPRRRRSPGGRRSAGSGRSAATSRRPRRTGSPGTAGRTSRTGTRWSPRPAPGGAPRPRSGAPRRRGTAPSCGCPRTAVPAAAAGQLAVQRGQQSATLLVDRAAAAEEVVVLADLGQPLPAECPGRE
jgi:hypothetical protein